MEIKTEVKLHNRFDIEVKDIETGEIRQKGYAENIVLNRMFDKLCNRTSFFTYINFGTGSGTMDPSRTTLFTPLGYIHATLVESLINFPVIKVTKKCILNPADYVGQIIKEVGVSETNNYINTHALIKDAEGNPLAIEKKDTDIVTIYATVFTELQDYGENYYFIRNNNSLITYFSNGGTSTVGSGIIPGKSTGPFSLTNFNASASWVTDIPNKKITQTVKLLYNQSNFDIRAIKLGDIANLVLPCAPFFDKFSIADKALGNGDGIKDTFEIANAQATNISVKLDGASVGNCEIVESSIECIPALPSGGSLGFVSFAVFSPDGQYLFVRSVGYSSAQYFVFYKKIKENYYDAVSTVDFMPQLSFMPDNMLFSLNGDLLFIIAPSAPYVNVYKKISGKYETINAFTDLPSGAPSKIKISASGEYFVCTYGNIVYFYRKNGDVFTKIKEDTIDIRQYCSITSLSISTDNTYVSVTTSTYYGGEQIAIYKIVGDTVTKLTKITGFSSNNVTVYASAFSPDGIYLCLGIADTNAVMVYKRDGDTFNKLNSPSDNPGSSIRAMEFTSDGKYIMIVSENSPQFIVYSKVGDEVKKVATPDTTNICYAYVLSINPNNGQVYVGGRTGSAGQGWQAIYSLYPKYSAKFAVPPAVASSVTADFDVPYIPKTEDYEVALSFELKFGEGV